MQDKVGHMYNQSRCKNETTEFSGEFHPLAFDETGHDDKIISSSTAKNELDGGRRTAQVRLPVQIHSEIGTVIMCTSNKPIGLF